MKKAILATLVLLMASVSSSDAGPSIAQKIARGDKFTVVFNVPSDNACGIAWNAPGNLLGNARGAGGRYTGWYVRQTRSWFFNGPVQEYPNCAPRDAPFEDRDSSSDPRRHQFMIWGRQFNFDSRGNVWDNNLDRYSPGGTTAPIGAPVRRVGRIVF